MAGVLSATLLPLSCACSTVTAAGPVAAGGQVEFLEPGRIDPAIPTPDSIIGHQLGAKAVRYPSLEAYVKALAAASPLVTYYRRQGMLYQWTS